MPRRWLMENFETESLKENAKDIKILYVESHAGTRLKFTRFLKEYFNSVSVVVYADNAVKLFMSGYFDLIITDANLPDMKVTNLCTTIKNIAPIKPIIIISRTKDPEVLVELINIGISGFIKAPFKRDEIVKILSKVVNSIFDLKAMYSFQDNIEAELLYKILAPKTEKVTINEDIDEDNLLEPENINLLLGDYAVMSARELAQLYPVNLSDIGDKLLAINEDIDLYINKFVHTTTQDYALKVADAFENFSIILEDIKELSAISFSTKKLSMIFSTLDYTLSYNEYYNVILQLSSELTKWRESIFIDQNVSDIHYLDKSFLSDALMLEKLFRGSSDNKDIDEDNFGDIEFF